MLSRSQRLAEMEREKSQIAKLERHLQQLKGAEEAKSMYDDDEAEDEEESESAAAEMDERIPMAKKNLNEVNASSKNYGPPHAGNMGDLTTATEDESAWPNRSSSAHDPAVDQTYPSKGTSSSGLEASETASVAELLAIHEELTSLDPRLTSMRVEEHPMLVLPEDEVGRGAAANAEAGGCSMLEPAPQSTTSERHRGSGSAATADAEVDPSDLRVQRTAAGSKNASGSRSPGVRKMLSKPLLYYPNSGSSPSTTQRPGATTGVALSLSQQEQDQELLHEQPQYVSKKPLPTLSPAPEAFSTARECNSPDLRLQTFRPADSEPRFLESPPTSEVGARIIRGPTSKNALLLPSDDMGRHRSSVSTTSLMFRIARDSCVEVDPPEVLENLEKPVAETRQEGASMTIPQEEQSQHLLHHQHQMVEVPVLEISSSSSASPVSVEVEVEVDHDNDAGQLQLQAQPPDEEASRGGAGAAALSTSKQDLLSSSSSSVELLPIGSRSTAYDPVAVVARQQDLVLVNAGSVMVQNAAADRAQATVGNQAEQQRATERTAPAARNFSPPAGGGAPAAKKTPDEASPKWTSIEEARRSYQREKINRKSQEEQRKSVEGLMLPQGAGGGPGRASFQTGRQSFGEGGDQDDYHDSGVLAEQVVQENHDVEDDSADAREQVQLLGKSQEQSSSSTSQPPGMVTSQKSGAVAFSVPFGSTAAPPAAETNKTAGGTGAAGANHPHPVGASSAPPVKIVPDHLPVTTRVEPNPNFFATATEEQKARRRSLSSDSARQQHKSPVGNNKQAGNVPQKSLDDQAADGATSTAGTAALQAGSSTRRMSFEAPSRTTSSIDPRTGEKVVIRRNQAPYAVRRTVTRSRSPQLKSRDGIATSSNPNMITSSSSSSSYTNNTTSRQEQLIGPREGLAMSAGGGVLLVTTDGDPHDRGGEDAYIKDASSKETILVASRRSGDHVDHVADETDKNHQDEALGLMQDELLVHRDSQEDLHQDDNSNLFGNTLTYSMDSDMKLGSCRPNLAAEMRIVPRAGDHVAHGAADEESREHVDDVATDLEVNYETTSGAGPASSSRLGGFSSSPHAAARSAFTGTYRSRVNDDNNSISGDDLTTNNMAQPQKSRLVAPPWQEEVVASSSEGVGGGSAAASIGSRSKISSSSAASTTTNRLQQAPSAAPQHDSSALYSAPVFLEDDQVINEADAVMEETKQLLNKHSHRKLQMLDEEVVRGRSDETSAGERNAIAQRQATGQGTEDKPPAGHGEVEEDVVDPFGLADSPKPMKVHIGKREVKPRGDTSQGIEELPVLRIGSQHLNSSSEVDNYQETDYSNHDLFHPQPFSLASSAASSRLRSFREAVIQEKGGASNSNSVSETEILNKGGAVVAGASSSNVAGGTTPSSAEPFYAKSMSSVLEVVGKEKLVAAMAASTTSATGANKPEGDNSNSPVRCQSPQLAASASRLLLGKPKMTRTLASCTEMNSGQSQFLPGTRVGHHVGGGSTFTELEVANKDKGHNGATELQAGAASNSNSSSASSSSTSTTTRIRANSDLAALGTTGGAAAATLNNKQTVVRIGGASRGHQSATTSTRDLLHNQQLRWSTASTPTPINIGRNNTPNGVTKSFFGGGKNNCNLHSHKQLQLGGGKNPPITTAAGQQGGGPSSSQTLSHSSSASSLLRVSATTWGTPLLASRSLQLGPTPLLDSRGSTCSSGINKHSASSAQDPLGSLFRDSADRLKQIVVGNNPSSASSTPMQEVEQNQLQPARTTSGLTPNASDVLVRKSNSGLIASGSGATGTDSSALQQEGIVDDHAQIPLAENVVVVSLPPENSETDQNLSSSAEISSSSGAGPSKNAVVETKKQFMYYNDRYNPQSYASNYPRSVNGTPSDGLVTEGSKASVQTLPNASKNSVQTIDLAKPGSKDHQDQILIGSSGGVLKGSNGSCSTTTAQHQNAIATTPAAALVGDSAGTATEVPQHPTSESTTATSIYRRLLNQRKLSEHSEDGRILTTAGAGGIGVANAAPHPVVAQGQGLQQASYFNANNNVAGGSSSSSSLLLPSIGTPAVNAVTASTMTNFGSVSGVIAATSVQVKRHSAAAAAGTSEVGFVDPNSIPSKPVNNTRVRKLVVNPTAEFAVQHAPNGGGGSSAFPAPTIGPVVSGGVVGPGTTTMAAPAPENVVVLGSSGSATSSASSSPFVAHPAAPGVAGAPTVFAAGTAPTTQPGTALLETEGMEWVEKSATEPTETEEEVEERKRAKKMEKMAKKMEELRKRKEQEALERKQRWEQERRERQQSRNIKPQQQQPTPVVVHEGSSNKSGRIAPRSTEHMKPVQHGRGTAVGTASGTSGANKPSKGGNASSSSASTTAHHRGGVDKNLSTKRNVVSSPTEVLEQSMASSTTALEQNSGTASSSTAGSTSATAVHVGGRVLSSQEIKPSNIPAPPGRSPIMNSRKDLRGSTQLAAPSESKTQLLTNKTSNPHQASASRLHQHHPVSDRLLGTPTPVQVDVSQNSGTSPAAEGPTPPGSTTSALAQPDDISLRNLLPKPNTYPVPKCKEKSNRKLTRNAVLLLLQGEASRSLRETVLAQIDGVLQDERFVIVFRGMHKGRRDFRALYALREGRWVRVAHLFQCPACISDEMVERYYRFDTGGRTFKEIEGASEISGAVDAVFLKPEFLPKARKNA
ncbi:unnamed protein product [Amoebophrya sp. A120]|nr:unnamed protein product [Amoebophrya sp. A120]|eukprot:GSA120T00000610001.1